MSKLTLEFKRRMMDGDELLDGVLCIKVVEVVKTIGAVILDIEVIDPKTGESLIELERIALKAGDNLKLDNLKKAFKVKIR